MNEQEKFWAGKFGNEYIERDRVKNTFENDVRFFSEILRKCSGAVLKSIIEFGAGIGKNLHAIQWL